MNRKIKRIGTALALCAAMFCTMGASSLSRRDIPTREKGAANGVATLDGTGKIPMSQIPAGASGNTLDGAYDEGGAGVGRSITMDSGAIQLIGSTGLLMGDGNDADQDLITIDVTGTPKFWWDDADDSFRINKSVAIGGAGDGKALLSLGSTTKGFLPSRMTAAQRDAITTPPEGLTLYDMTNSKPDYFDGTVWKAFVSTDISTFVIGSVPFATDTHHISDDNANFFWDNTLKRLGIGTNIPSAKLSVIGDANISSDLTIGNTRLFVDVSNGSTNIGKAVSGTDAFNVFAPTAGVQTGIASFYDSASNIKFRIRDQWTASSIPPRIESESSLGFALNTTTDAPFVWYINGTGNEKMRLTTTGLGIGTSAPFYHLTVADDSGINGPTLGLTRVDTVVTSGNRIARVVMMGGETGTDRVVGSIVVDAEQDWTATSSPTRMEFRTTAIGATLDTERMRITEAGYVGIGTNVPIDKLHVVGNGRIIGEINGVTNINITGDLTSDGTVYCTNAEVTGNVGIGTDTPTSKLQVVSLPVYANNAAAITGGLTVGAFYRTGADPDPVCVVH